MMFLVTVISKSPLQCMLSSRGGDRLFRGDPPVPVYLQAPGACNHRGALRVRLRAPCHGRSFPQAAAESALARRRTIRDRMAVMSHFAPRGGLRLALTPYCRPCVAPRGETPQCGAG